MRGFVYRSGDGPAIGPMARKGQEPMIGRVNAGAGRPDRPRAKGPESGMGPQPMGEPAGVVLSRLGVEALSRLGQLSRSEDEKIALAATQEILNRAFGKVPPPRVDSAVESQPTIQIINFADWLEQQMEGEDA